ncbi:MAG: UvrD-helicase domain-containing protein [Deltaproteobacteria bacterium]|nr:UvrD-helicase domain-containing protein [Deltaproteobacteria bacterium]
MNDSDDPILSGLNPQQREAVLHGDGPLLIFAGAGSGKTRVLTHRIAYLCDRRGVDPHRILAVTFTNKAAGEMAERVERLLPGRGRAVWVSTFHSFGAHVLRREAEHLGFAAGFSIYDETDQRALIRDLLRRLDVDPQVMDPRSVMSILDRAKNALVDPADIAGEMAGPMRDRYVEVVRLYTKELAANNAMDFGDLLVLTVKLFETVRAVRDHYRTRFEHLLVDEFQDTNTAQNRLLEVLIGERRNLCVVGDDDQSIYRWRGAKIENILGFEKEFPDAKIVILGQNYRSSATIVSAADAVIRHNSGRATKRLFTGNDPGSRIRLFRADSEYDEARFVASGVRELVVERGLRPSQIAVFYRTNALSRVIEEELQRNAVPFIVVGGTRFYDRKEIKDILAYLRLVVNPEDGVSAKRVINVPARKIGKTTVERIDEHAERAGVSFLHACADLVKTNALARGAGESVGAFLEIIADLRRHAADDDLPELVDFTQRRSGYAQMLSEDRSVESLSRQENLKELVEAAAQFAKRNPEATLRDYLEQVSLAQDLDQIEGDAAGGPEKSVRLMTLHNAKGLEFSAVFIVGVEEAILPHARSLDAGLAEIEEERRLCYVGITRARKHLTLSCAARRRSYSGESAYSRPSRFLDEIPSNLLEPVGFAPPRGFGDRDASDTPHRSWNRDSSPRPATNTFAFSRSAPRGVPQGIRREAPGPGARPAMPAGSVRRPAKPAPVVAEGDSFVDDSDNQDPDDASGALRPGARVLHREYGPGTVLSSLGSGAKAKVVVHFASVGAKTLMLQYANLKIL